MKTTTNTRTASLAPLGVCPSWFISQNPVYVVTAEARRRGDFQFEVSGGVESRHALHESLREGELQDRSRLTLKRGHYRAGVAPGPLASSFLSPPRITVALSGVLVCAVFFWAYVIGALLVLAGLVSRVL